MMHWKPAVVSMLPLFMALGEVAASRLLQPAPLRITVPARSTLPMMRENGPLGGPSTADLAAVVGIASFACVEPAMAADISWIAPTKAVLGPLFAVYTLLFLFRTVLSWFPKYDLNEFPYNVAAWPTEPLLKGTRSVIPPVAGVDITPIVWVAILSFLSEILLGPQGLLTILQKKG